MLKLVYILEKNLYSENRNIFISGEIKKDTDNQLGTKKDIMSKIKTALISVHDKDKLQTILRVFRKYKIKIISSGGTFKKIKELGYQCINLSEFTNFPELLDGRVKTLHPKIHAGILSKKR